MNTVPLTTALLCSLLLALVFIPRTYAGAAFSGGHKDHKAGQELENYIFYTLYNQSQPSTNTNNGVGVTIQDTGGAGSPE